MISAIFYVEMPRLYVAVLGGKIYEIQRAPRGHKINPIATVVETFDATFGAIHVADGRLHLDGLALIELMTWLHCERPATFKAEGRRLDKLFPNSSDISDLMRATLRCATGNEHQAHGDDAVLRKGPRGTSGRIRRTLRSVEATA